MASAFAGVRSRFVEDLDSSLGRLGVKVVGGIKGEWRQIVCPLCDDQNGSCDIAVASGHLKCKQCQRSKELFTWYGDLRGHNNTWQACQALAEELGIPIEIPKRRGRPPRQMTEDVLAAAVHDLWTHEEAEPARKFLRDRGLADPQILEGLGIGWIAGIIIFAQRWPNGTLKARYRKYNHTASGSKWTWSPGTTATQGLWPHFTPPADAKIVLMEGEFDVGTAWVRLQWHKEGIWCYTWTGGVKAIPVDALPAWVKGRRIEICYDNDVFQGPDWATHKAPNDKKRTEMHLRRRAMLDTARALEGIGCKVTIRAIPVDPSNWGGDFRDWVDAGGRDWAEVPGWSLDAIRAAEEPKPKEVTFAGVFKEAGGAVIFPAVVQSIDDEAVTIPSRSEIDCPMGSETFCGRCRVPDRFSGQVIGWRDHVDELIAMLLAGDPERNVYRNLLGKPSSCGFCRIRAIHYVTGCVWTAVQDDSDEMSDREIVIISEQTPTLSGEITVHGTVHHYKNKIVVFATKLVMRETAEINLDPYAGSLRELCPAQSNDLKVIDTSIRRRAADLAEHVTHVHGRTSAHIAALLLEHSVCWFDFGGHRKRGWLDIAIIGSTATGKSMTFEHMLAHHGLGRIHACMENVSRAGLTMGAASAKEGMRLRPGLFPRAHRKMLVLDEYHIMVEEKQDHPMLHLQSARDAGTVGGIKIYGARKLPAVVRLCTISNWIGGRRDSRRFACEHLLDLYGKPESLRRLDFAVVVDGKPDDDHVPVDHVWNKDLDSATILRAWSQEPHHVKIHADAIEAARLQCLDWAHTYSDELPLFTGEEKIFSLLRIAIAAANIVFSHELVTGELQTVVVRKAHVEWAIQWLESCWEGLAYDQYSNSQFSKRDIRQPFHVEAQFTCALQVHSADEALRLIDNFFGTVSMAEMSAYTGKDTYKAIAWTSNLVRLGAMERTVAKNNYHTMWRLTPGAHRLLKAVLDYANDFPDKFAERMEKLTMWVAMHSGSTKDPDLLPIELELENSRHEWRDDADGSQNIVGGPGSA